MKNIFLGVFLLFPFYSFGQSGLRLNLMSNLNYTVGEYNHDGEVSWFRDSFEYKMPLGYSASLEMEFQIDPSFSMVSGIRYSHNIMYPRVQLFYFVVVIQTSEGVVSMQPAYLKKHELKIISLPILLKKYFRTDKKISYYLFGGGSIGFTFNEIETYKNMFTYDNAGLNIRDKVEAKNAKVSFYNTAIEIGAGTTINLASGINLIIETSAQVFDFRKANKKAVLMDGELYWQKDSILPIGQVSLGLGLQKEF
ncbi:MAG: hypothetical protein ACI81W_000428 [Saprospiraceae bacterium]|jgi:hypothetical protein